MANPRLWRIKAAATGEADLNTVRKLGIEINGIGSAITIDIDVANLVRCRLPILDPHLRGYKACTRRQADPNASAAQSVKIKRIVFAITVYVGILNLIRCRFAVL